MLHIFIVSPLLCSTATFSHFVHPTEAISHIKYSNSPLTTFKKQNQKAYLKRIHISQPVLDVAVHHQLSQPQDLSAQMEGIPKTGFFSFLDKTKYPEFMSQSHRRVKQLQFGQQLSS